MEVKQAEWSRDYCVSAFSKFEFSMVGSRSFPVAAAKIWNILLDSLVSMTSLQSFRHHLKTLFVPAVFFVALQWT